MSREVKLEIRDLNYLIIAAELSAHLA
eukprot:Gb_20002 [translate_table: standard]